MNALLLAQDLSPGVTTPDINWSMLLPLLILSVGGALMLTVASLVKPMPRHVFAWLTAAIATGAGISLFWLWDEFHENGAVSTVGGVFAADGFSLFITGVICASVALTALLADDYLVREGLEGPELYVLMLMSAAGGIVMASANDLIVLFLGLEVLSIAVYVMAAMHLRRSQSQEAGLKYFVLGAFSSAFLLYGIAFVYGATGSTNLVTIKGQLAGTVFASDAMLLLGFALMLVGLAFKVAAVPFHAWTPDVYQGAPSPVVAYMASGVKAAGFAGIIRVFVVGFEQYRVDWQPVVYVLAAASLIVGSLLAVVQTDVKRMLAYSSISHAGFILLGVQAATDLGTSSAVFYLAAYTFMVAGSFGVVTLVGGTGDRAHHLDDYRGLGRNRPVLAMAFAILLFAQAGVPFTSGFFAKFGVINAAIDARSFWLAIIAMISAVIAAFLYLRIVVAMFLADAEAGDTEGEAVADEREIPLPAGAMVAIGIALAVTVVFGIIPGPLDELAQQALPRLISG